MTKQNVTVMGECTWDTSDGTELKLDLPHMVQCMCMPNTHSDAMSQSHSHYNREMEVIIFMEDCNL